MILQFATDAGEVLDWTPIGRIDIADHAAIAATVAEILDLIEDTLSQEES